MKKIIFSLLLVLAASFSFGQKNLTFLSSYTVGPGLTYAGVSHYNNGGHEYALLGTSQGLSIIDITNPSVPVDIFDVPDSASQWREVKTWSHYAYVSNEGTSNGGGGITIIDLSPLPGGMPVYKKYTGDGAIAGLLSTGHTVEAVDGYLYVNGSRYPPPGGQFLNNGGTTICSLADPWNPVYVGAYTINYVHDCFVRGDTLITSEIYAGQFAIINISDKANPVLLKTHATPSSFNHNTWMSDDDHYLYTTDEKHKAPLASYDISNLNNIQQLDLYWTSKNPVGEVHNVRVLNDFLVNACYGDTSRTGPQVTIVDASRPANLIEVGNYSLSGPGGFPIGWDVDPFLPSGNLIATDGNNGLFVFAPTYIRACYLEGIVTDSLTGSPLSHVIVEILATPAQDSSIYTGQYKTGLADAGTFNVRFSKAGYVTKTINNVAFNNGVLTTLNIKLWNGIAGIDEQSNNAALFYAYPNPAHHDVSVCIDPSLLTDSHHIRLIITDALGRTVKELKEINLPVITLYRNGIANGSYTIELMDDTKKIGVTTILFQ